MSWGQGGQARPGVWTSEAAWTPGLGLVGEGSATASRGVALIDRRRGQLPRVAGTDEELRSQWAGGGWALSPVLRNTGWSALLLSCVSLGKPLNLSAPSCVE